MNVLLQILLAVIGVLGIGSIITSIINNRNDFKFKIIEQKEVRYRSILLYMDVFFNPENIKYLSSRQTDIDTSSDVIEYLKAEYHEMLLYSPREVVSAVKSFIVNPNSETFYKCIIEMRKDLWIRKRDLSFTDMKIDK